MNLIPTSGGLGPIPIGSKLGGFVLQNPNLMKHTTGVLVTWAGSADKHRIPDQDALHTIGTAPITRNRSLKSPGFGAGSGRCLRRVICTFSA